MPAASLAALTAALPAVPGALAAAFAPLASTQPPGEPEGTIMPVVAYWPIWALLGGFLLLAVLGWYLFAILATRKRRTPPPLEIAKPLPDLAEVRVRHLRRIDEIEGRYRAGQLSSRRAHAALSVVVRDYVAEATGVRADRMTLSDLRRTPFRGTAHTVGQYYPIVFGAREYRGVEQGAAAARSVITRWL